MPTFTAIALDRLLEPASRNQAVPKPPPVKPSPRFVDTLPPIALPALYTTPKLTPLPDSPCSFTPSPYIVNHKRRGPRLQKPPLSLEDEQVLDSDSDAKNIVVDGNFGIEATINSFEENSSGNGISMDGDMPKLNSDDVEVDGESDDFFDFYESMSSASNVEGDELQKPGTPNEEFYSAYDEISSDGASRSPFRRVEVEMREMRLNLLIEIEKRKQAEEAVQSIQRKWQTLRQNLSSVGLVLPDLPIHLEGEAIVDPFEDLSQQIIVGRAVATSIARGCARDEVEMEIEPQIAAKNFEITRLLDRLRYYEAANREMSQRNQETVEKVRRERLGRNKRRKWFWGSIGLAVTLSSMAIAWSYLPSSKTLPSQEDCDH